MRVSVLIGLDDFNLGVIAKNSRELALLEGLIKNFPKIKITCFCSPMYSYSDSLARRMLKKALIKNKFALNENNFLSNNPEWVKNILGRKNLKLEMHGSTHLNEKNGSAAEFDGSSAQETVDALEKGLKEFKKSGVKIGVLSPPGWSVNNSMYGFCKKNKLAFANSFFKIKTGTYSGEKTDPFAPSGKNGVICVPRNADIAESTVTDLKKIIQNGNFVSLHGHAKNIGVKNGITEKNIKNLEELLAFLEKNYDVEYKFFSEIKNAKKKSKTNHTNFFERIDSKKTENYFQAGERVLIVEPHNDDAWLSLGGTMLKHKGTKFTILSIVGNNDLGSSKLRNYAKNVVSIQMKMLNAGLAETPQNFFEKNKTTRARIEKKIIQIGKKFDKIILPLGLWHPTHKAVGKLGIPNASYYGELPYIFFRGKRREYLSARKGLLMHQIDMGEFAKEKVEIAKKCFGADARDFLTIGPGKRVSQVKTEIIFEKM
jgi:hypothetical protein